MTGIEVDLKVSIIMAVLNGEKHIEDSIKSVINQSFKNVEIIIIDGGSTDTTLEIVNTYKNLISQVISEPDKGVYDAFNKGIKNSTGDVVYFLNSDDILSDKRVLDDVIHIFSENPEIMGVYGKVAILDELLGVIQKNKGERIGINDIKKGIMCCHQSLFVRKSVLEMVGFFDLQYPITADFDFLARCARNGFIEKFFFINRNIAVFRCGGISSKLINELSIIREREKSIRENFGVKALFNYFLKTRILVIRTMIKKFLSFIGLFSLARKIYWKIQKPH